MFISQNIVMFINIVLSHTSCYNVHSLKATSHGSRMKIQNAQSTCSTFRIITLNLRKPWWLRVRTLTTEHPHNQKAPNCSYDCT